MTTRWCVVKKRSGEMTLFVYTVWHHEVSSHIVSGKVLYNLLSGLSIFVEGKFFFDQENFKFKGFAFQSIPLSMGLYKRHPKGINK